MATRTAKGAISSKVADTKITLSNVSLTENHGVIVIVGFHGTALPTSVEAGLRDFTANKAVQRINSTEAFGAAVYYIRRLKNGNTRDFVATWAASTQVRSLQVITIDKPILFVEAAGNIATTASPTTSSNLLDLPTHDCFHVGYHVAKGGTPDVALTFPADWVDGQRDGTAGVPPASNITISEAYKFGRCIDPEESTSTGTDSRAYCSLLCSFKIVQDPPPYDFNGAEVKVGDTVVLANTTTPEYTVASLDVFPGHPMVRADLGSGLIYETLDLEVVY